MESKKKKSLSFCFCLLRCMTPVPVHGGGQPPAPPHVTPALPPALLPPSTPHPQDPDPGPRTMRAGGTAEKDRSFPPTPNLGPAG